MAYAATGGNPVYGLPQPVSVPFGNENSVSGLLQPQLV